MSQRFALTYSICRLNPPQKGSQGEAPHWVLYSLCGGLKSKLL